jgi:formate dehydrogenase
VDFPNADGVPETTGVSLNELTDVADRDWFAGTPWHKHTPARVEAI